MIENIEKQALSLLKQIIAIPSLSGDEELLSRFLENWLRERNFIVNKKNNNIWVESILDESLPRILLNS
ncbi:MAG: acetylornithine deacetylase, partial [Bacteroidota bacterium]